MSEKVDKKVKVNALMPKCQRNKNECHYLATPVIFILHFHKVVRVKERMVQIESAEAEVSRLLVPSMDQTPETLDPAFPIVQLSCIRHSQLGERLCLSNSTWPVCNTGLLL